MDNSLLLQNWILQYVCEKVLKLLKEASSSSIGSSSSSSSSSSNSSSSNSKEKVYCPAAPLTVIPLVPSILTNKDVVSESTFLTTLIAK
ncbi:hypothetical protein M0802_001158 [Mischocyttarus mexicanus]|nr:hypothetical protein M0802_001158 [Mischocyttarus mexicanus]